MGPTLTIVLLWVAFAITHLAFSSLKLRPRLVGVLGEFGFMGAYSLIALVTFVPMVSVYFGNKHSGPMLWSIPVTPPIEAFVTLGMGVALLILVAGFITPSPASMVQGKAGPIELKGIHFITPDTRSSWRRALRTRSSHSKRVRERHRVFRGLPDFLRDRMHPSRSAKTRDRCG